MLRHSGDPPVDPSQPGVRYVPSQNKTYISSSGIQLEGTPEKGVTVVLHFSVAGDVNKITPKPPGVVGLDFAAFSEKPKFPNLTNLVFLSDNQIVYQTQGQFSTSKIANDNDMYSEFLYLKVPTAVFVKISSGSIVKITLNEHEYTLTESQLLQIKRMSDYIR